MTTLAQNARTLFGIALSDEQVQHFAVLEQELIDWNTRINLTAIVEPEAVRVKHFLDSLSVLGRLPGEAGLSLLDVGAGAGFPGLPLAILRPDTQVTLMEATAKKLRFIEHVAERLGLANISTLHARAEDAGQDPAHRERYDVVTARAVARLPVLLEYTLPLIRVGGRLIAMKGSTIHDEIEDSGRALGLLGGQIGELETVTLPGVDEPHFLLTVHKRAGTPSAYPRQAGTPGRTPLL